MDNIKYAQFLDKNSIIQKVVFAIELLRNNYNIPKIETIIKNYDFAEELLELQKMIILLKEIDKYNDEWANKEKDEIKELRISLVKSANGIVEKLEVMGIEKQMIEDLDYVIGEKSMPNIRNIKRLKAIKLVEAGKSYNEIATEIA